MKLKSSFILCSVLAASLAGAQQAETPVVATPGAQPGLDAMSAAQIPAADVDFLKKAAVGGMYEVQSSEMATTAAQNADIKAFAQQMIADHTAANQELKALAASKNVPLPNSIDQAHMQMMTRLKSAKEEQFDNTYVRQQNRAHREAVTLFQQAAASATTPEVKAFAQKTLPVLQHHAEMAKSLPGAGEQKPGAAKKKPSGEPDKSENNM